MMSSNKKKIRELVRFIEDKDEENANKALKAILREKAKQRLLSELGDK